MIADGVDGLFTSISQPKPDVAAIAAASAPLSTETDETMRRARLLARVLFNQGNGTFSETNAVADDFARLLVAEIRKVDAEQQQESIPVTAPAEAAQTS